jgi:4-amino-4-deoxy-L-arabinose transferase-like glycosyltransferase
MIHKRAWSLSQIITLFIVLCVAFGIRIASALQNHSLPKDDAYEYDRLALSLVSGQGYRDSAGQLTARRPPFYSFFLASIYSVAGHNYQTVRMVQAVLSTATVLLIAIWTWILFGGWSGCLAASIAAVYPAFYAFYYGCSALLTETLYTFLLSGALVTLYAYLVSPAWFYAVLSGILWGLAILTRPIPLALLPFLPFLFMILGYPLGRVFQYHFIAWSFILLILAPWIVRNYLVFGTFVPVATMGGSQFYSSNHPDSDGFGDALLREVIYPEEERLAALGMSESQRSKYFYQKGVDFILSQPQRAFQLFLRKVFLYLDPIITLYQFKPPKKILNWGYISVLLGSLAGCLLALRDAGLRRSVFSLILIFGSFLMIYALWHPGERYRFPTEPLLIVMTSFALCSVGCFFPSPHRGEG